jgi:PTH1 family peptidyl-tRNA hydrolase
MRLPWRREERDSSYDLLVVGLGNPGREYARTRHNVGFMVVDELARRYDGAWKAKFGGQLADVRIENHKIALFKPETFMNLSGQAVSPAVAYFKLTPEAVLVVHDESDLEHGRLQARLGGGSAGHNGIKSVAKSLGTPYFLRLRVGVGRPERGDRRPLADYVLANFEPHEDVDALVRRAADAVETLDADGLDRAQVSINGRPSGEVSANE